MGSLTRWLHGAGKSAFHSRNSGAVQRKRRKLIGDGTVAIVDFGDVRGIWTFEKDGKIE